MTETTHRHRWEDITERTSPYAVQRCNGLGGCGTIRRIGKGSFPGWRFDVSPPPDVAWEIMFQGAEGPALEGQRRSSIRS